MSIHKYSADYEVFDERIMNGETAVEGEAPWAAFIVFGVKDYIHPRTTCGGVIINKKWILTAAHCLDHDKPGKIYVGSINRSQGIEYTMDKHYSHSLYANQPKQCPYDVGLIKVREEIKFQNYDNNIFVNSICLPKKGLINTEEEWATMYGWGITSNVTSDKPELLQKAKFVLSDSNECNEKPCYCSKDLHHKIDPKLTCKGDSGSGLIQKIGPNKRAVVIGITSGIRSTHEFSDNCGNAETNWAAVSVHIDWILKTMKNT